MSAVITLLALVGLIALFPILVMLAGGVFYWTLGSLLQIVTVIVRGGTALSRQGGRR